MEFLVASYGGGVNSKAMLIEWRNRGMPIPRLIMFADTGGEKPATYAEVESFSAWLESVGYPPIAVVRSTGKHGTLEAECLTQETLPSLAFGWKKCSDKYKARPQNNYVSAIETVRELWKTGGKVLKLIGIDAGEQRRAAITQDKRYNYRYPLVEWDIDRDECVKIIEAEGLPVPTKSSCFFCPASKKHEILSLANDHPDLFARAVAMEENAAKNLDTVKGLGRRFAWGEFVAETRRKELAVLPDPDAAGSEEPCMCYDG